MQTSQPTLNLGYNTGFTLIELSIVIVIIGLIVGGVLVGRDLISAAEIRSQISQIQRFNVAANTFKAKYNYLPGDIPDPYATQLGLTPRLVCAGDNHNGNDWIDNPAPGACNEYIGWGGPAGEGNFFWLDLNTTGIMPNNVQTGTDTTDVSGDAIASYLPRSALGSNLFVYVWGEDGFAFGSWLPNAYFARKRKNFLSIAGNTRFCGMNSACGFNIPLFVPTISVIQTYNIDKKIDDGLPQSGLVTAAYIAVDGGNSGSSMWSNGEDAHIYPPNIFDGVAASSTTCYDQGGVAGVTMQYSVSQNGGAGKNCALTFQIE
jgi:prepilin-type N-terminal cleavage/methylation domain-containing protein